MSCVFFVSDRVMVSDKSDYWVSVCGVCADAGKK